jgi:hypothetical protein
MGELAHVLGWPFSWWYPRVPVVVVLLFYFCCWLACAITERTPKHELWNELVVLADLIQAEMVHDQVVVA